MKLFMIITHLVTPAKGQNTSQKNWKETAKWNADESITIASNVNRKALETASIILDIAQLEVVKCRIPNVDRLEMMTHYINKYAEEIKSFHRRNTVKFP